MTRMNVGSLGEALAVAAIVNTLTEFPQIRQVQILVEGKQVESLAGHVDVSRPLTRNEKLIKRRPEGFLPTSKSRSVAKTPTWRWRSGMGSSGCPSAHEPHLQQPHSPAP
ncbi:MAG: GerMN domain-containing protein [Firmicutes bacterium]|nr:GerMN domain-containing protein [Bacillota bacterium]